jgi:hypothetical protein
MKLQLGMTSTLYCHGESKPNDEKDIVTLIELRKRRKMGN